MYFEEKIDEIIFFGEKGKISSTKNWKMLYKSSKKNAREEETKLENSEPV